MDSLKNSSGAVSLTTDSPSEVIGGSNDALVIQNERGKPGWRRWAGYFWDTLDGDVKERRYIQKLDTYLLSVRLDVVWTDLLLTEFQKARISALDTS